MFPIVFPKGIFAGSPESVLVEQNVARETERNLCDWCDSVLLSLVPQRRRITHTLRAEVVEHYAAGMSCRRVAAALGLGRTTVLQILKAAGIEVRPQGRKY